MFAVQLPETMTELCDKVLQHWEYAWMRFYITHQKRFDKMIAEELKQTAQARTSQASKRNSTTVSLRTYSVSYRSEFTHNITLAA